MTRAFFLMMIAALTLSACGRKGDLEAPSRTASKASHGETHTI